MINITTDSKAINWLLSKTTYSNELNQEDINDGCTKFITGQFQGNLSYKMTQEIKTFCKKNYHTDRTYNRPYTIRFKDETINGVRELISATIDFGKARKTTNQINLVIDHTIETV